MASIPEFVSQSCGAVGLAAGHESLGDLLGEDLVLLSARTKMLAAVIVKTAAADVQGETKFFGRVRLGDGTTKMVD